MIILFYFAGAMAILTTICVIVNYNPIYALLYLVFSLLSVSCIFFSVGAPFAGAIEIIIYAGAIMVLFVFVIMMFNMNDFLDFDYIKCTFLPIKVCFGVLLLISSLLVIFLCVIFEIKNCFIDTLHMLVSINQIGITLFGSYMLIVEAASFLLLSALVSVLHISRSCKTINNFTNIQS